MSVHFSYVQANNWSYLASTVQAVTKQTGCVHITLVNSSSWSLLTNTLHGLIAGAQARGAAYITSSAVRIQALLTFCAKIAIETCFTVVYFTFWKTRGRHKQRLFRTGGGLPKVPQNLCTQHNSQVFHRIIGEPTLNMTFLNLGPIIRKNSSYRTGFAIWLVIGGLPV